MASLNIKSLVINTVDPVPPEPPIDPPIYPDAPTVTVSVDPPNSIKVVISSDV
jgi:hypothetical protein